MTPLPVMGKPRQAGVHAPGAQGGRASSTLTIISPVVGVHIFLHFLFHFLLYDHLSCGEMTDDDLEPTMVSAVALPDHGG